MDIEKNTKKVIQLISFANRGKEINVDILKNLIDHCDINKKDENGWTILMYLLYSNQKKNLGFSPEKIYSLIEKSDIYQEDKKKNGLIFYVLFFNQKEKLNLNQEQMKYLFERSSKEHQERAFIMLAKLHEKMNLEKELKFILYDCNFFVSDLILEKLAQEKITNNEILSFIVEQKIHELRNIIKTKNI